MIPWSQYKSSQEAKPWARLPIQSEIHIWVFRLTSSYIFLFISFIKDRMHPRKYVVLHQSIWTLGYIERKPLSFTRSTTKRDGMRNQRGFLRYHSCDAWEFFCVQQFFFSTLTGKHLLFTYFSWFNADLRKTKPLDNFFTHWGLL